MIREALEFLHGLSTDAQKIEPVEFGRRQVLVRQPNGQVMEMTKEQPPRMHTVHSLESLTRILKYVDDLDGTPMAFIDSDGAYAYFDHSERDDFVTLPFEVSSAMKSLEQLQQWTGQRDLIRVLRSELAGTFDPKFLAVIRRLDFSRKNDGRGEISHTRESLGRSVEKTVQSQEGDIPDTVPFTFSWLDQPRDIPSRITAVMAVDVDMTNEMFRLLPVGDSIESAQEEVLDEMVARVAEELQEACVVRGNPGLNA